jgi:hypothetical protein
MLPSFKLEHHDPFDYFPIDPVAPHSQMGLRKFIPDKEDHKNWIIQSDPQFEKFIEHKINCLQTNFTKFFIKENKRICIKNAISDLSSIINKENQSFLELSSSLQEDLVVVCLQGDDNWVEAASICFPNGWDALGAVGKSFDNVHENVPNIKNIVYGERTKKMIKAIIDSSYCFERVGAISINTSPEWIRHPAQADPRGAFTPNTDNLYIRFERQVCKGYQAIGENSSSVSGFVFLIKTYMLSFDRLTDHQKRCFLRTVKENPKGLYYHDWIAQYQELLLEWIKTRLNDSER